MAQENQSGGKSVERSHVISVDKTKQTRLRQGDIIRGVDLVEYVVEEKGQVEASLINYPLVIVLTQDCDLEQDANLRKKIAQLSEGDKDISQNNLLLTVLVAPLYNAEHVYIGEHLSELELSTSKIEGKGRKRYKDNEVARYHYLEFPNSINIVPSIIDFKHFFTANLLYLAKIRKKNFVCSVGELFREDLALRFAAYLSRIALPQIDESGRRIRLSQKRKAIPPAAAAAN